MIVLGGLTWVRLAEAIELLAPDATPSAVRRWAAAARTQLVGRERWYVLEDLQDEECRRRTGGRGRPRRSLTSA